MDNLLFIHATNVHQGGGRLLLEALLNAVNRKVILSVDSRMPLPVDIESTYEVRKVRPSVLKRLLAEKWLAQVVKKNDVVLCFGNLPPLFRLRGNTVVFLQNRYLLEDIPLIDVPLKIRIRILLERLWLNNRLINADEFIVQTSTMKRLLELKTRGKAPVRVLPFVADPFGYVRNLPQLIVEKNDYDYDFVYVATGEPHKNHLKLLEAWKLLAQEGVYPSLCLTIDRTRSIGICRYQENLSMQLGLRISNIGLVAHKDILALYKKSRAVIYPSRFESFGLPLIEARQAGLPVLAPELDYVRDLLDPEQVFDPDSPVSIARAVKRHMGISEAPLPLMGASHFLSMLLDKGMQ